MSKGSEATGGAPGRSSAAGSDATGTAAPGPQPHLWWVNQFAVAPGEGGGTRHYEMSRLLVGRGWRVTVVASDLHLHQRRYLRRDPGDRAAVEETIDGVDFRWLWAAPYRGNDWRRAWNWLSFGHNVAWSRFAGERPDAVIGSSPQLFAALGALILARRHGLPFILEVRDLWPETMMALAERRGPGYHLLDRVAWYLYERASRIVVLARGSADYLADRGVERDRLVYIPNGVDPDMFGGDVRPERATLTFLYAGAHGPLNGLDAVIGAADRLRERSDIRFLLVGDGPVKEELVEAAGRRGLSNIEFRDPVAKRAMPALMGEADAGLMVLRQADIFEFGVSPNKLFDYFGAGLPVVCNVPGGVARMVAEAGGGVQARDAGAGALADAVERVAALAPAERLEMGESGRSWVAREHNRHRLADRLARTIREVVAENAGAG